MTPSWDLLEVDAEGWEHGDEQMGTKEKFWVDVPGDDRLWLLKLVRQREENPPGEDWAEWMAHHLATQLGVPSARIRPASWKGRRGIVSRAVQTSPEQLVHGNSVLFGHDPTYGRQVKRENSGYTVAAVHAALEGVSPPSGDFLSAGFSGFDVWAGYVLLDAWIAGRDRHYENWAVIRSGGERRLAPSFDHGNSLGNAESDGKRMRLLDSDRAMERWLRRGTSHHFAGRPALTEVAFAALDLAAPQAKEFWLNQLESVTDHTVTQIAAAVPQGILSEVGRTFVLRLLEGNRRRLLNVY